MAALVHLVRNGEVDNPQHIVCGDLPGFGLSPHGLEQARRVGRYLGPRSVVAIWSSPLERALRTAEEIAARSGVPVRVDPDLRDWSLMDRWKGQSWRDLPSSFPGELERFLERPRDIDFADESLQQVAQRVTAVARRLDEQHPHGDVIMVTHESPMHAAHLTLTGSPLDGFSSDKPGYGAVITLRPGTSWKTETTWEPSEAPRFGEKSDLRLVAGGNGEGPTSA